MSRPGVKSADNWPPLLYVHPANEIFRARRLRTTTRTARRLEASGVSIQVAILKILASHDSGRATTASLKRDIAILATSGPDWNARMRRLAGRVQAIDVMASGYVLCDGNGWQITAEGRAFLRALEAVTQDNLPAYPELPAPDEIEMRRARPPSSLSSAICLKCIGGEADPPDRPR
jgi:hypothetical protein